MTGTREAAGTEAAERFAFLQGLGKELYAPPVAVRPTDHSTSLLPPAHARGARGVALPLGTRHLLSGVPFGEAAGDRAPEPAAARLGHALLAAFGVMRREPHNIYNDHRAVPSVRSKFPVHAFVEQRPGGAWYLDPYRHALVRLDGPAGQEPAGEGDGAAGAGRTRIVLAGRVTDFPLPYQRLRSALVLLETGINLRMTMLAAELLGLGPVLAEAGTAAGRTARRLGLDPADGWCPPLVIELDAGPVALSDTALPPAPSLPPPSPAPVDPAAGEVAGSFLPLSGWDAPAGHGGRPSLPHGPVRPGASWAEVLSARNSGRAAAGADGFSGRRLERPRAVLDDHLGWAAVPPPPPLPPALAGHIRLSLCAQDVTGVEDGLYRVTSDGLEHVRDDGTLMARISAQFGYPRSETMDSGVVEATLVWVFHTDTGRLLSELGPQAWALAQLWCGWVTQGLCLASASHGMYARPARSYDEVTLQTVLDLPACEVPLLMVVCGTARYREPALGLWT
ncbi:hypothetical protein [Streptomyces cinnamoneus]|uniref:hypothetical protein n=1 Tax=Streptomyces cinnamoneus TaxID=53446 RepID=UPI0037A6BD90